MTIRDDMRGARYSERPREYHAYRLDRFARTLWRCVYVLIAFVCLYVVADGLGAL